MTIERLIALALFAGCEKAGPPPDASPLAAVACVREATTAKNIDRLLECILPAIRNDARGELVEEAAQPGFWDHMAEKLAPLFEIKAEDFTISAMPAGSAYGDQHAFVRYSKRGKLDLVRSGGRWYVGDLD